jgi:hypothetical protein
MLDGQALHIRRVAVAAVTGGGRTVFHGSFRRWACRPGWLPFTTRM